MSKGTKRVSDAIKPVLADTLTLQTYAAMVALPGVGWFFALPVVSHFTKSLIGKLMTFLVMETAVGLSVLWILMSMGYEVKNAEESRQKLKDMLDNPAKYTKEEADAIEEDFDDATIDLIQLGIERL